MPENGFWAVIRQSDVGMVIEEIHEDPVEALCHSWKRHREQSHFVWASVEINADSGSVGDIIDPDDVRWPIHATYYEEERCGDCNPDTLFHFCPNAPGNPVCKAVQKIVANRNLTAEFCQRNLPLLRINRAWAKVEKLRADLDLAYKEWAELKEKNS
jgi:hypothetical protein